LIDQINPSADGPKGKSDDSDKFARPCFKTRQALLDRSHQKTCPEGIIIKAREAVPELDFDAVQLPKTAITFSQSWSHTNPKTHHIRSPKRQDMVIPLAINFRDDTGIDLQLTAPKTWTGSLICGQA
jgi:hypothetical protein